MSLPAGLIFTPNASTTSAALSAVAQVVTLPATGAVPNGSQPALVITNPNSTPALVQLVASAPPTNLPAPSLIGAISVHGGNLLIVAPNPSATVALLASTAGGGAPATLTAGYVTADVIRFPDANNPQNVIYVAGQTH